MKTKSRTTFSLPNSSGVFSDHETIRGAGNDWKVELHIAQADEHDWRSSYDLRSHGFGAGSWPSIYDKKCPDRGEAVCDAIRDALRQIKLWEEGGEDCAGMKKWLLKQMQPSLF